MTEIYTRCPYTFIRGKKSGKKCDKVIKTTLGMCYQHRCQIKRKMDRKPVKESPTIQTGPHKYKTTMYVKFRCQLCPFWDYNRNVRDQHFNKYHKIYNCSHIYVQGSKKGTQCNKKIFTGHSMCCEHRRQLRRKIKKRFKCSDCDKTFMSKNQKKRHRRRTHKKIIINEVIPHDLQDK